MGIDWRTYRIEELCEFTNGFAFKSSDYIEPSDNTVEVFRMGYIERGGGFKEDSTPVFVPRKYHRSIEKFFLQPRDITIAMTDMKDRVAILGNTAWISDRDRFVLNQRVGRIRVIRSDIIDPRFIYFYSNWPPYVRNLRSMANSGVQVNLGTTAIREAEIKVPPLSTQRAIVDILGTLDDKIELNRQMNTTLESMAQALFKSWFVDFDPVIDNALAAGNPIPEPLQVRAQARKELEGMRKPLPEEVRGQFPNSFVFNERVGWLPEGWTVREAQEIASINIGKTPPRKEAHWFSEDPDGNVVWVSIRDMGSSGVFIGNSSEYLVPESIQKYNVKVVPENSVILSFKMTLGRVAITKEPLTTNEAIAHFVDPKYGLTKEYLYCYLRIFDYERLGSTSSIATAVNSKLIKAMPFVVPSHQLLEYFYQSTRDWFVQMSSISEQIETLTKLRDTLLPKLLSGQLRIPEAEQAVAEVI